MLYVVVVELRIEIKGTDFTVEHNQRENVGLKYDMHALDSRQLDIEEEQQLTKESVKK